MKSLVLPLLIAALLALPGTSGCTSGGHEDHWQRALALERELLRRDPDAGYDNSRYVLVLRELQRVPRRSQDRAKADRMAARIADARRILLVGSMDKVDHLPRRLRGQTAPEPPRPAAPKPAAARGPQAARSPRAVSTPTAELALTDAQKAKLDVILYSTAWCGYCKRARSWLQAEQIPFVEKDIEKDTAAHAEYRKKAPGYSGVPLLDVNGKVMRGFDQGRVSAEIKRLAGS